MDQELKQRLIGAAVITALAAIFVPMLFDDPIDESGKSINELTIPELPTKAQDVEIMPLPEKVEDVATVAPVEKPPLPAASPAAVSEGDEGSDTETPKPLARITAKETAPPPAAAKFVEPDVEDEDVAIRPTPVEPAAVKPVKPVPTQAATETPVKAVNKPPVVESTTKPVAAAESTAATRLYLNAGSFSQLANAQALQDTLKKQGFAASIKETTTDKGKVFKVRVGPMLDKAKAQAVKSKLSQININSFVTGDE